ASPARGSCPTCSLTAHRASGPRHSRNREAINEAVCSAARDDDMKLDQACIYPIQTFYAHAGRVVRTYPREFSRDYRTVSNNMPANTTIATASKPFRDM